MGGRGKGKEMRGFFAAEQAPSPNAAQVLVSEAKLFLCSYRESYETALLEKGQLKFLFVNFSVVSTLVHPIP